MKGTKITIQQYRTTQGFVWAGVDLPETIDHLTKWVCELCGQERYTSYKTIVGTAYRSGSKCPSCSSIITLWVIE